MDIDRSGSQKSGNVTFCPVATLISSIHPLCESASLQENPQSLTLRLLNCGFSSAALPSSIYDDMMMYGDDDVNGLCQFQG